MAGPPKKTRSSRTGKPRRGQTGGAPSRASHKSSGKSRSVTQSQRKVKTKRAIQPSAPESAGDRIAKVMARAGLCSRREAERWIGEGRVKVNGAVLSSPAYDVRRKDRIEVDGQPLPEREPVRLWRYHKPRGLVTTHRDPQARPTVFDSLPKSLPRVISVGRLDFNSEGLLLLTNDGDLARHLEMPATGWLRRYRVRAHGRVDDAQLNALSEGLTVEGVKYGPIEAQLDSRQGANQWLTVGLREGKNREVRRVLAALGLDVNRLIRVSYGPFQLLDLKPGAVEPVRRKTLIDQLGPKLSEQFGLADEDVSRHTYSDKGKPARATGKPPRQVKPKKGQT